MQINKKPRVNYAELIQKKLKKKEIKESLESRENCEKEYQDKYIEESKKKLVKKNLVFGKKKNNKEKDKLKKLMKENEILKKQLEELEQAGNQENEED